jgi:hypothetical protein
VAGGNTVALLDWVYVDERVAYPGPVQNLRSQLDSKELVNARLSLADVPMGDAAAACGTALGCTHCPQMTRAAAEQCLI